MRKRHHRVACVTLRLHPTTPVRFNTVASTRTLRHVCLSVLCLGLSSPLATPATAASQPLPPTRTTASLEPQPLQEEQIHSIVEKITKPVDTDAEAMRHNDLGVAFVFKGDVEQAVDEFKHALRLQPNYFAAHLNLANTLLDLGRYEDALAEFKQALKLKPDDLKARNDFGVALKTTGDLGGAVTEFKAVLQQRPDDVHAHNNLGVALKAMGDLEGAIAEYRTASDLQPTDVNTHFNLGLAFLEKKNVEGAINEFRTALHLRPNDGKIRYNLGQALANYQGFNQDGFEIVGLFDDDPAKIGSKTRIGIEIQSTQALSNIIRREAVEIVILAVPAAAAERVLEEVTEAGVRAVLNFAPVHLNPKPGVKVKTVDLTISLESLSYFLANPSADAVSVDYREFLRQEAGANGAAR